MVGAKTTVSGKKPSVGYEAGDTVYAHSVNGPVVLKVLASGADGFTGEAEDGEWHKVPHDKYLGHKARTKHAYTVADEGEDGCLLADETGQCRYVAGKPPQAPEGKPNRDNAHRFAQVHTEDRKLDGMGSLSKAFMPIPLPPRAPLPTGLALLLKASGSGAVRTAPVPKPAAKKPKKPTDKAKPKKPDDDEKPGPILHKHGDLVAFRHGDVWGSGIIQGSGEDGVTILDMETGREHLVRHDALLPEHPPPPDATDNADVMLEKTDKPDKVAPKSARKPKGKTAP